mmetsp:Transcript_34372/g.70891  ORF Transcript_34372/g.70891 Transcript_34372/m.70891 type:complete len:175 (-) Transcript_34372:281-805(-)|eukprot:CAMPEP_0181297880 /NCGR_PEP_ID=MMETSP1101-20121128/5481_1 /TAXON_ID=46948 /ORGANISM="Rhodomonas abbreviata, Strain Caron Lab Isolate" /LENGTH=174 /DNA_ID=CAMNT_0023402857 /DNA_START=158 /DNA_END=682 /DNA_ORIENTATION=-
MAAVARHPLDDVYSTIRTLSTEELKGLLEDDSKLHEYFERVLVSFKAKQDLVRKIKKQNLESAKANLAHKEEFDKVQSEVEEIRVVVAQRQQSLMPLLDRVEAVKQEDSVVAAIARLEQAVSESEAECREMASATDGDTNWNKFANDFIKLRKTLHYRQALLERLTIDRTDVGR